MSNGFLCDCMDCESSDSRLIHGAHKMKWECTVIAQLLLLLVLGSSVGILSQFGRYWVSAWQRSIFNRIAIGFRLPGESRLLVIRLWLDFGCNYILYVLLNYILYVELYYTNYGTVLYILSNYILERLSHMLPSLSYDDHGRFLSCIDEFLACHYLEGLVASFYHHKNLFSNLQLLAQIKLAVLY